MDADKLFKRLVGMGNLIWFPIFSEKKPFVIFI